jgi:predicted transcriptional regulator
LEKGVNMPSKKPILTIRTDEELIEKLREISEQENRSMSNLAETILREYVVSHETKHKRKEHK